MAEGYLRDVRHVLPGATRLLLHRLELDGLKAGKHVFLRREKCQYQVEGKGPLRGCSWKPVSSANPGVDQFFHPDLTCSSDWLSSAEWGDALRCIEPGDTLGHWAERVVLQYPLFTADDLRRFYEAEYASQLGACAMVWDGRCYFFDEDRRFRSCSLQEAEDSGLVLPQSAGESPMTAGFADPAAWQQAAKRFELGASLNTCLMQFLSGSHTCLDGEGETTTVDAPSQPPKEMRGQDYERVREPVKRILTKLFVADGLNASHYFHRRYLHKGVMVERYYYLHGSEPNDWTFRVMPKTFRPDPSQLYRPGFLWEDQWDASTACISSGKTFGIWLIDVAKVNTDPILVGFQDIYDLFLQEGRHRQPIQVTRDWFWYFDEALICRRIPIAQAQAEGRMPPDGQKQLLIARHFCTLQDWSTAAMSFQPGDTLEECLRRVCMAWQFPTRQVDFTSLENLVLHAERPIYERATGNTDVKTVDFIRLELTMPSKHSLSWEQLVSIVKKNRRALMQMAAKMVATDARFRKLGVPINFFRLSNCTLTRDRMLVFTFELKEINAESSAQL